MPGKFRTPSPEVSDRMRKVRSRDTGLEAAMERILGDLNVDYEPQPELPGKPDFRVTSTNVLLYCDSSFWHGRRTEDVKGRTFRRNRSFWTEKLRNNRMRDGRVNRRLRREGWSVQRFWDTDILKKPEKVRRRLERIMNERR